MDLFNIWQSAQQSFSEFEKENRHLMIIEEPFYFNKVNIEKARKQFERENKDILYRISQFKPDQNDTEKSSLLIKKGDIYTSVFLDFWELYNKSRDKKGTYKKWLKLSDLEKSEIMFILPEYIESTPDKKFRKDPKTYLNQKSWKDEIINHEPGTNKKGITTEQLATILSKQFD